jgi:hypothetical protein
MITKHWRRRAIPLAMTALLGAAGVFLSVESLGADTKPFGCACLHNTKTSGTINYRFRWGDREWKSVALGKGKSETMCWAYKDAPKSPELEFQLDVDMTGGVKWETFSIPRGQSSSVSCSSVPSAAHYHVGYVANTDKKKIQIYPGKS